jgi:hypothetical protein
MLPAEIFLLGILIFKGLTARRLYKSFGVKRVNFVCNAERRAAGSAVIQRQPNGEAQSSDSEYVQ